MSAAHIVVLFVMSLSANGDRHFSQYEMQDIDTCMRARSSWADEFLPVGFDHPDGRGSDIQVSSACLDTGIIRPERPS